MPSTTNNNNRVQRMRQARESTKAFTNSMHTPSSLDLKRALDTFSAIQQEYRRLCKMCQPAIPLPKKSGLQNTRDVDAIWQHCDSLVHKMHKLKCVIDGSLSSADPMLSESQPIAVIPGRWRLYANADSHLVSNNILSVIYAYKNGYRRALLLGDGGEHLTDPG
jgi:hypothetical protein